MVRACQAPGKLNSKNSNTETRRDGEELNEEIGIVRVSKVLQRGAIGSFDPPVIALVVPPIFICLFVFLRAFVPLW